MFAKTSLSGFPEWLPEGRIIENAILDHLRKTFELHGFASLETRSVETLDELQRKGETSKEVYILNRLQELKEERSSKKERPLGLHFDLTVPFARFVIENAGSLAFPFRRYQIQKVWRGERPQDGRFREFMQADIDIVGDGALAFHHEVELPLVMIEALSGLPIPPVTVLVNNRKVVQGFCEGIGIESVEDALRAIDKLDKIGAEGVMAEMLENGISAEQGEKLLEMAAIRVESGVTDAVLALGVDNETLRAGLEELDALLIAATKRAPGRVVADLKIARGLDYYTGSVYETVLEGHEDLGSICSGGRYDSLATNGKRTYPGVGLSIGVSRLVSRILGQELVHASRSVPSCVLVAVNDEEHRSEADDIAYALRSRGIPTEVSPNSAKFGKQIKFADKRGIPFVWFTNEEGVSTVKDIRTGEQVEADAATWMPPATDLLPTVVK
ncbi:histidine--tRNA ligase [Gleimia coleocanis DSM 15436]|uniref:Histidine--tRNA ligase n=1 Tax=Gleimia coleocanis DSM 15436 TaxID=525245 RepID=C0W1P3_9ACTO|nr:histidine--tRNA ligase [Gleimia coleocanis]EEH63409.1 histidine--tRNA ligase [Gleimia coleocanis DSM 15436]